MVQRIEEMTATQKIVDEEEEVRRIREQQKFKATPVKHYKLNLGYVSPRKLTQPVEPNLQTNKRAELRELNE